VIARINELLAASGKCVESQGLCGNAERNNYDMHNISEAEAIN